MTLLFLCFFQSWLECWCTCTHPDFEERFLQNNWTNFTLILWSFVATNVLVMFKTFKWQSLVKKYPSNVWDIRNPNKRDYSIMYSRQETYVVCPVKVCEKFDIYVNVSLVSLYCVNNGLETHRNQYNFNMSIGAALNSIIFIGLYHWRAHDGYLYITEYTGLNTTKCV